MGRLPSMPAACHLLQQCTTETDLRRVQSILVGSRLDSNSFLAFHLIRLLASFGYLVEVNQALAKLVKPTAHVLSVVISTNAKLGQAGIGLELCHGMEFSDAKTNNHVYLAGLKACSMKCALEHGRFVHEGLIKHGLNSDVAIGSSLIDMYAKCGSLEDAWTTFEQLPSKNLVCWGAMIGAFVQHGEDVAALKRFGEMGLQGLKPDNLMILGLLRSCGVVAAVQQGRLMHSQMMKIGFVLDDLMGNALVNMYAKCGYLEEARKAFDTLSNRDESTWGAIIAGYVSYGESGTALDAFMEMKKEGKEPNRTTILNLLKACASAGDIEQGKVIHEMIIYFALLSDICIASALVDMYSKCGSLDTAQDVFNKMSDRNVVSWGAMIGGYVQHGEGDPAFENFEKMRQEGFIPNKAIFLITLKACVSIGSVAHGRLIHEELMDNGVLADIAILNTLLDMYAKCGNLEEACRVFYRLPYTDVVSWSALIAAYAHNGHVEMARQCFEDMQQEGVKPNQATFTNILSACSHAGLIDEGRRYFESMRNVYGVTPDVYHYSCMLDLLGRGGCLDEAGELVGSIPQLNIIGWTSLLSACRVQGNLNLGNQCFREILQLDPGCASGYALISNVYADSNLSVRKSAKM